MNNRQSKPSGKAPSWGRVAYDLAWFIAISAVTLWLAWGAETPREFAGAVLGIMFALLLGLQAFAAAVTLSTAAMAEQRHAVETALNQAGYETEVAELNKPGPY